MTNDNERQRPAESADERARRIAEARARAEAARQARLAGQAGAQPPAEPPSPAEQQAPPPPAEAAGGEDERARRIAEARARAEAARAARGGEAAPPAQPQAETGEAGAAARGERAPESADERARRIAEARARAMAAAAARTGGAAPPVTPPQRTPEEEAARQARLAEARARAQAAAGASAAVPAPAAEAPAARATAAPVVRPLPPGVDEWRAPAGTTRVVTARPAPEVVAERALSRAEVANIVTRRTLLRTSFWATLGVTIAGFLLGFVNFFWPRKVTGFGGVVKIQRDQLPNPGDDPKKFFEIKGYIVNLKPGEGVPPQFTSFAQPSEKGGILALYQKCPHLGCAVPWRPEFDFEGVKGWFRCPCHGSTYTKAGVRVFGPAPRPMDTFEVKVNPDGSIEVNTGRIHLGGPDNPQRAIQLT